MDNRHKGIPDNPDIMWITPGTYTGRKQHPHPSQQTRTRCYGGYRDYGGYQGYGDYRGHPVTGYLDTRGTGNHRGTVDTVGTGNYLMPRVTKLPRLHSYRGYTVTEVTQLPGSPGYQGYRGHTVTGLPEYRGLTAYVQPGIPTQHPAERTLITGQSTFIRRFPWAIRANVR